MASQSQCRPLQQRRGSATEQQPDGSSSGRTTEETTDSDAAPAAVVLNTPHSPRTSSPVQQAARDSAAETTEDTEDTEPRRCWICFNDETEDDETTSEWRSPCPCVLVAHERCLLDWIADMEAPNARRLAGSRQGRILCPQCRSEIRLQRPRSLIVEAVRAAERVTGMLLLPGVIAVAGAATVTTLSLIGRAHIYHVFGAADGLHILAPLYRAPDLRETSSAVRLLRELQNHWRLHVGLPLIPTVLMLTRTTFADSFLPFIPLIFFVSSGRPQDDMLEFSWPPSAAFTVAALPYLRGIYNAYYERVWLPREQKWLKEIQPRAGTESEQTDIEIQIDDGQGGPHLPDEDFMDGDDDMVEEALEVEVDFDIFADWNNGGGVDNNAAPENPPVPIARGPAPPLEAPLPGEPHPIVDMPHEAAPAPDIPQQPPPLRPNRVRRERNIAFSTTGLADTILGALVFPSIAAAVGEALKYALPKSWVTAPIAGKPTGILQARWGRSILGGCLFVGVKDAIMLYVRWKMAQNHRKRSVLDYDNSLGKNKARKKGVRT